MSKEKIFLEWTSHWSKTNTP